MSRIFQVAQLRTVDTSNSGSVTRTQGDEYI